VKRRHAQRGVTLVEAAIGGTLVAVALVGTSGAVFSSVLLQETTTRKRNAARAVSSLIADVRASDIGDLVANYDGSTHAIDYGSGQTATATVTVAEAPGTAGARPVYRVQIAVASAGAELDGALAFVAYVCDHSDSVASGTRLADVSTPDGVLLDWVTDTEVAIQDMNMGVGGGEGGGGGGGAGGGSTKTEEEQIDYDELLVLVTDDY